MTKPDNRVDIKTINPVPIASAAVWAIITSNTKTARAAPTGSIIIPSQRRIEAKECFNFICRSKGVTTVGPETIRIEPKRTDKRKSSFKKKWAKILIKTQQISPPKKIRVVTALRVCFKS